ncbi:hypothetical protein MY011_29890 [Escherichia coli]|nr:hypothetical protein ECTW15901_1058 [Escherichia coli TW15901]GHO16756.1 hypothetical protein MY011_29890 [Escherichia coli]
METVSDALKALKKASSHVVAARLGISREEAVNELWELKRNGVVDKTGHTWFLAGEGESRVPARWCCAGTATTSCGSRHLIHWINLLNRIWPPG